MFKAIATDVDGTITDSNEKIDPEAIIKIRELEKLNIPVILISGHNLCSLETLSEYIGTSGPIVAENGCVVSKEPWGEPIIMGSRKITFKALNFLKQKFGDYKVKLKPLNRYRNVDLSLYRTFNTNEANELLKKENINAFVMDSGFAIHIIDSKINKGVGVKKAAELMGINTKEIIGIGDGGNDYHFLKEVGYSIALGHSHMKIKNIANFITKNSYGSGFVEAINHVVKNLLNL
jgi:phosphoglycolate phosphatase (TIGR01487 family)